jgi:DNA-binding MurR/RpiR family transcriptional regulator
MNALERIRERFASLSPKIQSAARFVIDHPNEVVIGSMRTLAERAAIQPATFVRLAQQLGYAGWPELKADFASELGLSTERYGARAKTLTRRARHTDLAAELFAAYRDNLELTRRKSAPVLKDAARLLQKAAVVHVAGFRASFPIVYPFFYGYRLFRHSVQLVDGVGGNLEMLLRAVTRGDAVLVASFSPYSREAIVVAENAKAAGARVVAITDSAASPLALLADVSLLFSVASPSFFPSVAAGVAIGEALLEQVAADAGTAIVKRIDAAERQLFESGAYLDDPGARRRTRR